MTFTEKTIKKAMKGGWDLYDDVDVHTDGDIYVSIKGTDILEYIDSEVIYLDPNFWKALFPENTSDYIDKKINPKPQPMWLYQQHRFIDHRAEEKSAESFFKKLKIKII